MFIGQQQREQGTEQVKATSKKNQLWEATGRAYDMTSRWSIVHLQEGEEDTVLQASGFRLEVSGVRLQASVCLVLSVEC